MAKSLIYDKLFSNSNARVIIALPSNLRLLDAEQFSKRATNNPRAVVGLLTNRLSFGGSNNFNTPLESAKQESSAQQLSLLKGLGARGLQAVSDLTGTSTESAQQALSKFSLRTLSQTINDWVGSSKPIFNVSMIFIATNEEDDVRDQVSKLLKTTYPSFGSVGLATTVFAPLGYTPFGGQSGTTASGTITVQVGKWFRATGQVATSVEATFSEITLKSGAPLFAEVNFSFQPYRIISHKEVSEYLLQT